MTKSLEFVAPANGEVVGLTKTADQVFAQGKMGIGFGLQPKDGTVLAPVAGKISMIAATKHAIGLTTATGVEVLIHMGLDTVSLKGAPFTIKVSPDTEVQAGQPLAQMDLAKIKAAGLAPTILVVATNAKTKLAGLDLTEGVAKAGQVVAQAYLKEQTQGAPKKKLSSAGLAAFIVQNVGGKANIVNLIHCITRLRFYLKDESKANTQALKNQPGILDVRQASGQYQVVIGLDVVTVFDEIIKIIGPLQTPTAPVATKSTSKNPLVRNFENLIGFITGSMTPVIGVIAAAGIIKGFLALLTLPQLGSLLDPKSVSYITVSAMADSAFFFLPILVGYSAARRLGSDPIIAAVIGGVLVYPQIIEWGRAFKVMFTVGSVNFQFLNYTYSIFPMILAAWLAKKCEDWLKSKLPSYLHLIFVPLVTVLAVSTLTLVVTGPIIQGVANGIAVFINWLVHTSGWLGGFIIGGLYQVLVIFGLHWGVVPLVAQQIAGNGESGLNAIICSTMIAQGAAVLAVALKSRKANLKELGLAATVSAFCGVTEPAIYGISLRYRRVFISGSIGAACGGLVTGLMNGTMYGFTGGLIGFSSFFNPKNPGDLTSFYAFLLASIVTIVVAFLVTWFWGYNDQMVMTAKVAPKKRPGQA